MTLDFLIVRYRSDGSLDPSFGSAGRVYTDLGGQDWVGEVVIQPDGKIVAAGNAERTQESDDFGVVRYNANGTLDGSFGEGGKLRTQVGVGNSGAYAIALQGNGKIVVAGVASSSSDGNDDLALVRYNRDGSLDRSFGAGGTVLTALTPRDDHLLGIAIDADGKVVAGAVPGNPRTPGDAVLARYNRDGSARYKLRLRRQGDGPRCRGPESVSPSKLTAGSSSLANRSSATGGMETSTTASALTGEWSWRSRPTRLPFNATERSLPPGELGFGRRRLSSCASRPTAIPMTASVEGG